ncbi:MAG: alpha/beta hydrolase [Lachnospiraceae bacterium]|nr:alpha/beta hydrolase [Lachnospiraceae bacterium]
MSIQIETVKTDTFEMDFFRFGKGDRTLVIIPGLSVKSVMESADQIAAIHSNVIDDFTIYVIDRRRDLPSEYSVDEMAADTAEAILKLGLKDIFIFGASQGGMIALEIAIDHPELVKKIAVGSTSANLKSQESEAVDEWIKLAKEKKAKELYLAFGKRLYPPKIFDQFKDVLISTAETVTDDDMERFVIFAEGMRDFDITDKLQQIQCPALVTGSFEDEVLDSDMTMEIAEKLDIRKDFELYMYNGFGHASFDIAPDYLNRLYSFFLK